MSEHHEYLDNATIAETLSRINEHRQYIDELNRAAEVMDNQSDQRWHHAAILMRKVARDCVDDPDNTPTEAYELARVMLDKDTTTDFTVGSMYKDAKPSVEPNGCIMMIGPEYRQARKWLRVRKYDDRRCYFVCSPEHFADVDIGQWRIVLMDGWGMLGEEFDIAFRDAVENANNVPTFLSMGERVIEIRKDDGSD